MFYFRLKKSFQIVSALTFIFSLSACQVFNHSDQEVIITVGDTNITKAELRKDIVDVTDEMGLTDNDLDFGIRPVINKIVEKYLIMEYGKEMEIEISDDELASTIKELKDDYPDDVFEEVLLENSIDYDSWKEGLYKKLLFEKITQKGIGDIPPITFDETQAYYNAHMDDFKHPLMIQLRQIVVNTKEEAEMILKHLTEGEDMGELAKEFSITPDAQDGGIMGWISEGQLEESIEDIVFSLKEGKRSDTLESPYGFHIFEVMDIRSEGYDTLPEVMQDIEDRIILQKRELRYNKWISDLKDRYPVKIDEDIYTSWNKEG